MGCNCGKPKCDGQCGCKSPAVLQINNPPEYITFHKVSVPAAMGDSTTNPPTVGKYKNVLLYYEADQTSWLYSTDGIPTKLTNGITNYEDAINLPQINGHTLLGNQSSSDLGLQGELTAGANIQINNSVISATDTTYTAGANIQINGNTISATDTTYTAGNGIELDGTKIKAKIGDGLEFDNNGEIDIADIEQYAHFFDNVADMKASENLIAGSYARTTGYYSANDGGGALYKIRAVTNDDVIDEAFLIEMGDPEDQLVAELIVEDKINIKSIGARPQAIDNTKYDIKPYIDKYIAYITRIENRKPLYIPSGIWYASPISITKKDGFDIQGDFGYFNLHMDGTVITTLNDNQQYLLSIGTNIDQNHYVNNWNLQNIQFSTFDYAYDSERGKFNKSTPKKVTNFVVSMLYAIQGSTDNIEFINCIGECLRITSCWENKFPYLVFRYVSNPTGEIMTFRGDQTYGQWANTTANEFTNIFFESSHGDLIGVYAHSAISNCHFGNINFEPNSFEYNNEFTYTSSATLPDTLTHMAIIKFKESGASFYSNVIDSINTNGFPAKYYTYNSTNYVYDRVIETTSGYNYLGLTINNIVNIGGNQPITILKNDSSNQRVKYNYLNIGYIQTSENSSFKFDIEKNFPMVSYNGDLTKIGTVRRKLGNAVKFYKMLDQGNNYGTLTTQDDSIFDDKICTEFQSYVGGYQLNTVLTGTKFYVLAKIPSDRTVSFKMSNESTAQIESLVGTGAFKWYEITSNFNVGDKFRIAIEGNATSCYFDSYIMA